MKKVVFIMGSGHCGSTLLDLILGSHSRAFSLGEFWAISHYIDRDNSQPLGACSICVDTCSFWDEVVDRGRLKAHFNGWNSSNKLMAGFSRRFGSVRNNIYEHLFDCAKADVLIDSSKSILRIKRQLWPFWHWRDMVPYLLYITRDGRAVTNSYLRKYPERGMAAFAKQWAEGTLEREAYFSRFPKARRCQISYESLVTKPEETIQSLCAWLQIPYEAEMLRFWRHEHHMVAGNLGPRMLIFKYREQFDSSQVKYWSQVNEGDKYIDQSYYDQIGLAIKLDLRWQRELNQEQLKTFEEIAGKLNQKYAFEPA